MVQFCSRPTLVEILRGMEGVLVERVLDIPATSSNSGRGWRLIVPLSLFLFFTFNISSSPLFKKTSSVLFAAGLTRPPPIPFKIKRGSNRSCPSTSRRNPILMVIKKKKEEKVFFKGEEGEKKLQEGVEDDGSLRTEKKPKIDPALKVEVKLERDLASEVETLRQELQSLRIAKMESDGNVLRLQRSNQALRQGPPSPPPFPPFPLLIFNFSSIRP